MNNSKEETFTQWLQFYRPVTRHGRAQRIMTTWEDLYERPAWQRFLEKQGSRQGALASFVKATPPVTGRAG